MGWWQKLRNLVRRRPCDRPWISVEDRGFWVHLEGPPVRVWWQEISEIVAFKRDLFALDLICLRIKTCDGWSFEINEDIPGFKPLVAEFERQLPGFRRDWFRIVALPAFEPNVTLLYQKVKHVTLPDVPTH